jgi:hypothetical protein
MVFFQEIWPLRPALGELDDLVVAILVLAIDVPDREALELPDQGAQLTS